MIKVRNDLEKMSVKLAVRDTLLRTVPKRWGFNGSSATKERERFQDSSITGNERIAETERDIAVELKKEYKPYLDADVQTIKEFPKLLDLPKLKATDKSTFQYTTFSLLVAPNNF